MGGGTQYFPWVHIQDIARLFEFCAENDAVEGVVNGVAPHAVKYAEFNASMSRALGRPAFFWVPSTVANVMFGERSYLFLEGAKIVPKKTEELGFKFNFEFLEEALKDIVNNKS
jgi:NAD dependent epimerase/dehydratase family enzyme